MGKHQIPDTSAGALKEPNVPMLVFYTIMMHDDTLEKDTQCFSHSAAQASLAHSHTAL